MALNGTWFVTGYPVIFASDARRRAFSRKAKSKPRMPIQSGANEAVSGVGIGGFGGPGTVSNVKDAVVLSMLAVLPLLASS